MQNPDEAIFCNRCGSKLREVLGPDETDRPKSSSESHEQETVPKVERVVEALKPEIINREIAGQAVPSLANQGGTPGGWLVLLAIGLFLLPIQIVFFVIQNSAAYSPYFIGLLFAPESTVYNPTLGSLLVSELIVNGLFIAWVVVLLVFFFRTARIFRWLTIAFMASNAIIAALDALLTQSQLQGTSTDWTGIVRPVAYAAIWIPYLLRSKRVAATFVN
jgi:hypothetical protein